MHGRINVVETPTSILLTNVGSFLPGTVERVIQQDAPLEIYRNPFMAEAMVNLNMIDTQGGGIKRDLPGSDQALLPPAGLRLVGARSGRGNGQGGDSRGEQYTRLLMERTDLDLWQVMLLDKIQKRITVSRDDHRRLKVAKLVEGRYPNLLIAGQIAKALGQPARHIRERGFSKQYYLDMILSLVGENMVQ